ncbi:MAG: flagellar basal body rod protein FlgB [Deltaproteobacteria bacterium]|nr:flagellar basal body rod protein FlgB [Deltaproteobacteria bacterium]
MEINSPIQNRLMGKTIRILSRALDFRSANHRVISENLANIDTPGYRPKELRFDQELQRAADKSAVRLKTTDPGHFSHASEGTGGAFSIRSKGAGSTESGQLSIDMEMAKMMRNNLLYEASVRLLSKKFQALKTAIEAGRR